MDHAVAPSGDEAATRARAQTAESQEPSFDLVTASGAGVTLPMLHVLQRSVGNRAVSGLLAARREQAAPGPGTAGTPSAQRWTNPLVTLKDDDQLIKDGIGGDVNAIHQIRNYYAVSPDDRLKMIGYLINGTVGPLDEKAIVELWSTFGNDLLNVAPKNMELWSKCADNPGVFSDVRDLPPIKHLGVALDNDVQSLAIKHLDDNAALTHTEMKRLGIPEGKGPSPDLNQVQQAEYKAMANAANAVSTLQHAQQTARRTYVGWDNISQPAMTGDEVVMISTPATFSPFHPPSATKPLGQTVQNPKLAPYDQLKTAYDAASAEIEKQVKPYPLLYAVSRDGDPEKTRAFAALATTRNGPAQMRAQLTTAVTALLNDIDKTRLAIAGAKIDPLDLSPVLAQVHAGSPGAQVNWAEPLPNWFFGDSTKKHSMQKVVDDLEFKSAAVLAGLLAPLTGGASIFILFGVAAAETGMAIGSWQEYQRLDDASKTAVQPGTQVVSGSEVEAAGDKAVADTVAAVLATACALGSLATLGADEGGSGKPPEEETPPPPVNKGDEIGPPTKTSTGDPNLMPRPREWPYQVPPNMVTVEPGQPLDVASLNPRLRYIWAVDEDSNFRFAPERQSTSDFMKPLPKDKVFALKHGDLVPGPNGMTRGPARAGGEIVNVQNADGTPSDLWELNNDSSYTFARVDDEGNPLPWAPAESLDAVVQQLEAGGTQPKKLVSMDVLAHQRPPAGK